MDVATLLRRLGCSSEDGVAFTVRAMRFRLVVHACPYGDLARRAAKMPHPTHHVDPVVHACNIVRLQSCACGGTRLALGFLWHRVQLERDGAPAGLGLAVDELFADLDTRELYWLGVERYAFDFLRQRFEDSPPHTYDRWDDLGVAVHALCPAALAFMPATCVASCDVPVSSM